MQPIETICRMFSQNTLLTGGVAMQPIETGSTTPVYLQTPSLTGGVAMQPIETLPTSTHGPPWTLTGGVAMQPIETKSRHPPMGACG